MMLDLTPEQKMLNSQYELLKKRYAELFAHKNDMLMQEENLLMALYLNALGKLQHLKLCLTVEIKMIMQRISLFQSYVNRNEYPDKEAIDKEIQKRFADYLKKIKLEEQRLTLAKEYLKEDAFLPDHEVKKLKEVYRLIVRKLHPDINPDASEYEKDLLVQAQAAYDMANLQALNSILLSLNIKSKEPLPDLDTLKVRVEKLNEAVNKLQSQIDGLESKFPFTHRERLADKQWIETEQQALNEDIDELEREKAKYSDYLALMNEWKPVLLNP